VTEVDLELGDGRTLHVYDTGADDGGGREAWGPGRVAPRSAVAGADPPRRPRVFDALAGGRFYESAIDNG
jgi:hypothetical protein